MLKKFLGLGVTLVMILALTSCSGKQEKEARELYGQVMEEMASMEFIDADIVVDMDIESAGKTETYSSTMNVKGQDLLKETIKVLMPVRVTFLNNTKNIYSYYDGTYFYMNVDGYLVKYKQSIEETKNVIFGDFINIGITKDLLTKISVEKVGSRKVISYTASGDTLEDQINALNGKFGNLEYKDILESKIKEISGRILLDEKNRITKHGFTITLDVKQGKARGSAKCKYNITFNNIGQPITVEFPDLSGYQEIDQSEIKIN